MKINCNRDFESMQAEGYFNTEYTKGDMPAHMDGYGAGYDHGYGYGMDGCRPYETMGETMPGVVCPPVYECPQETVMHRYICHEVPHIMPCNTRIINHHIYRHTYTPTYSCCEENEVQNVYERRCC